MTLATRESVAGGKLPSSAMSGPSIFISYAHEDGELARALGQALPRRKCPVWIDEGEMRVGDSLIERIATAIREVEFVVALVSEASVGSNWCKKELSLAITGGLGREGVKVLPLRVGNVEMPAALTDTFWLALGIPSRVSPGTTDTIEGNRSNER